MSSHKFLFHAPLCGALALLAACEPAADTPETVARRYFDATRDGDFAKLVTYLTPDGRDAIESVLQLNAPQLKSAAAQQKERYKNVRYDFSPAKYQPGGMKAFVTVTAHVKNENVSLPMILHKINGQWKISYYTLSGLETRRFSMHIEKALLSGEDAKDAKDAKPAVQPAVQPAAKPAAKTGAVPKK